MTYKPRTKEEVYESLRDSLTGKISKLTNFTDRSFNYVWTQAFSEEVRKLEVLSTVAELAGWIDYTGGPVSETDLNQLNLDEDVSTEEINELMDDSYLDEFVKIVGVTRLPGARATGNVDINTQSSETTIPEGTVVTTVPDSSGETINFLTTQEVTTASGVTTVTDVPIQAADVGDEHNLPAGTIVRFADPPIGVKGVENPSSTTGGTDEETNDELRSRAKKAVQSSALGGTVDGIKGYIRQNVEGVGQGDVIIDEFTDPCPPYVDVIVDGGLDTDITEAIEFARPTGVNHNLVRPQTVQLGFEVDVRGTGIDTTEVREEILDFLLESGINDDFYEDELIRRIMSSDEDIVNIDNIGGFFEKVENETFTYQTGTSDYRLDYTYESTNGSITVEDDGGTVYTQGTDYQVNDQTGDGWPETLVWIGSTPDDDEDFSVEYDVTVAGQTSNGDKYYTTLVRDEVFVWTEGETDDFTYDANIDTYLLSYVPFDGTSSITDDSGDTYAEGTDYEIIDNTGNGFAQTVDWSIGGGTPDDNEGFTVTYDQRVYHTEYEHRDTPKGEIRDDSGDVYEEDVDYITVDYDADNEKDAIEWLSNPAGIASGDEFYFSYLTEGDRIFTEREKADPGTVNVEVV